MDLCWTIAVLTGCIGLVIGQSCTCPSGWENAVNGYTHVTYDVLPDNVNVPNPGRGFFRQVPAMASHFGNLRSHVIPRDRTVIQRMYYMDKYINRSLDGEFIRHVKTDLNFVRRQGWMAILRFSYTNQKTTGLDDGTVALVLSDHPKDEYNAVYKTSGSLIKVTGTHDAGLQRTLEHIEYLGNSSLFNEFEGVIATVQAGFIGVWGEWYEATADYGKPGSCSADHMFHLSTSQWAAREAVLRALLRVIPESIQIELRYPWLKYKMFGNTPTTFQDIQNRTDRGRIGFHNDAFLSTSANMGTYKCAKDKAYLAHESRYLVVSGETNDNRSVPTYQCSNAMAEMTKYHWSLLNEAFLHQIIDYWKQHGCYDEIAAKLGYRLYLLNATLPQTLNSGGSACFELHIGNNGYAAPYKEMDLHIIFTNTRDGAMYSSIIRGYDVRRWLPGQTYLVKGQIGVPSDLQGNFKGKVDAPLMKYYVRCSFDEISADLTLKHTHILYVYFALTDKIMQYNEKYFVLMANRDVDTTSLRINDLKHVINITRGTCTTQSNNVLTAWEGPSDGCRSSEISDGSFEDEGLGWKPTDNGFKVILGSDAVDGNSYITVTNGGASQTFDFSRSPINSFTLSGYSRSHSDTSIHSLQKYSIKCDIYHTDGTKTWNIHTNFDQKLRNVWMFRKLIVQTDKPIASARCYALYETGHGSVDFDNFVLNTCIHKSCEYNFTDGSFEDISTWKSLTQGYHLRTGQTDAVDGNSYITLSNGSIYQKIDFKGSAVTEFTISGYSRAHGVTVNTPSDYSISCDLQYADGTSSSGEYGLFDPTVPDTDWQPTVLHVAAAKVITYATCQIMLKDAKGHADFDNFQITSCV